MPKKENCKLCGVTIERRYYPMKEWETDGPLCGKCYSKKLHSHYPGDHVRVSSPDD